MLKERIESELKDAMRARDEVRLNTLRHIKTLIKNKEVELIKQLDDAGVIQVIATLVKQRKEAIEQFGRGGRTDLVEKETRELSILQTYMPSAMSEDELKKLIEDVVAEEGASGPKDMGKVMKAVMAKAAGRVDGKLISELVKNRLK